MCDRPGDDHDPPLSEEQDSPVGPGPVDDTLDLSEPEAPDTGLIALDTVCRTCGYNLRGLLVDTTCPECGAPVADSAGSDRLRFADRGWLRRMIRGTTMFSWASVGLALIALLTLPVNALLRGRGEVIPALVLMLLLLLLIGTLGFAVLGVWLMTCRESVTRPGEYNPALAWTARIAVLVGPVLGAGFQVISATAASMPGMAETLAPVLVYSLVGAGIITLLLHLRLICPRIPDHKLRRSTLIVAVGVGCCFLLFNLMMIGVTSISSSLGTGSTRAFYIWQAFILGTGCAYLLGGLVFGVWMLMVIDRYRRAFTAALRQQRRERRRNPVAGINVPVSD